MSKGEIDMLVGLILLTTVYSTMCAIDKSEQLKERKRQQERLEALYK